MNDFAPNDPSTEAKHQDSTEKPVEAASPSGNHNSVENLAPVTVTPTDSASPVVDSPFWRAADAKADWLSDFANPILVKEIRQALKSKSFLWTFAIVLLFAWGWSIFGIALRAPTIYYVPGGRYMLLGYFLITLLPLLLIVPFATFRSLAAEREDGTYELLSITDLKPWSIIFGKLTGAVLQIAIFLSALTPCLAITYFLRGIDIFMILLFIGGCVLLSVLLCGIALLMAAQAKNQRFQAASSIALLLMLMFVMLMSGSAGFSIILTGVVADVRNPNVWIGIAMVVSMWFCLISILILGAAASIKFASDNRSTALRIAMLVTHAIWFGWVTYFWQVAEFEVAILYAYVFPTIVFWWIVGAQATGESTRLTPRVRRGLPQSFLGRMSSTLFFPGRGLGYFFAIGNLIAMLIMTFALQVQSKGTENVLFTASMGFCYVAAYVGLTNLLLRYSSRYGYEGAARGVFVCFALVIFGVFIPLSIQLSNSRIFGKDYHQIQASNPFWTMVEITDGSATDFLSARPGIYLVPLMVSTVALCVLLANFFLAAREIMAARAAVPMRVEEEIVALSGAPTQEEQPASPWDN